MPSAWYGIPGIDTLLTKENPERERERDREVSLFLQKNPVFLSRKIDVEMNWIYDILCKFMYCFKKQHIPPET